MIISKLKLHYTSDIFKSPLLFIPTLLLVINSGFFIKHYFVICPIYLSFYLAICVLVFLLFKIKKILIPISGILCIMTILYQLFSQFFLDVRIWSLLASISTISFYIITLILLSKMNYRQVLFISDCFLAYNFLLYLADTIYRFSLFNYNIINIFINFYEMKESCFIFGDTNSLGINTTILTFFAYYLFKLTHKNKYIIYIYLFSILTFFTFSRAAILATFISFIIFIFFKHLKQIFKTEIYNSYQIPLSVLLSHIFVFIIIALSIPLGLTLIFFLMNDGSFLTKIAIFNDIVIFFQKSSLLQLLFGIGFDNAENFVGMYAHNYLATYLIETGIMGYILITTFLLRILYEAPKTIYIFLPFSILGISFIGYSILNLFYVALALIIYFEYNKKTQDFKL